MKIEHLREYIALARTLNFSATARYLNISQPVLSSHIKAIEQELGVELLSRNQHRVRLNKSGQITYEHALRIVEQYDAMSRSLDDYMSSISSTLTIGYLYNAYKNILPRTTSSFSNEHPSIGISLESLSFRDLHKALREGELDIALTLDVDESLHEFYEVKTLGKDRICCVVRRDDPLAAKQSLSLEEIKTEAFILPDREYFGSFSLFYDSIFSKAGFKPNVAIRYKEPDTRHLDIEAGGGIALVGEHFRQAMGDSLIFIPLQEDYCSYNLIAAWKKSNYNHAIPAFLNKLKEHMR